MNFEGFIQKFKILTIQIFLSLLNKSRNEYQWYQVQGFFSNTEPILY